MTLYTVSLLSEGQRSMTAAQTLIQQVDSVSRELGACDQQLSALIHKPLPQNNLGVQDAFRKYRVGAFHCTKHWLGNGSVGESKHVIPTVEWETFSWKAAKWVILFPFERERDAQREREPHKNRVLCVCMNWWKAAKWAILSPVALILIKLFKEPVKILTWHDPVCVCVCVFYYAFHE